MPDPASEEAFARLLDRIEELKRSERPEDVKFCQELAEGKMLGVLTAEDQSGATHTLYAFSGQIGDSGFRFDGFVGPVFDYLQPAGYFKTKEAEISLLNRVIEQFEKNDLPLETERYEAEKEKADTEIARFKEKCRQSRDEREARRAKGLADEAEKAAMIRQSQFEKAELRRLKQRLTNMLQPLADNLRNARTRLAAMKERRKTESEALQKWLFSNFRVLNARGESRSLSDIFSTTPTGVPPSGAGECCAPKLLQTAYIRGWKPVAIAEYWYGKPKGGEVRRHGSHYPACRGKCLPVLGWMLQGLQIEPPLESEFGNGTPQEPEILFENRWFCIVSKPSGMLSVPGKSKALSVQKWLEEKYGEEKDVKMAHRLDQDTSGLLIATFGPVPFKIMQRLFATRKVRKTYIAITEGDYRLRNIPSEGRIELPLSPDLNDRPRQRVDSEGGKPAVTDYEFNGVSEGRSRVTLHPQTGRTHQLRVHLSSESGLGLPIAGDRLYGCDGGRGAERLLLHAQRLEFTFPIDGKEYIIESPVPF